MINQNMKPYFNQVTMIQSQYESKRKILASPNSSSLISNKSPLRQRENTNSINTPSRINQPNGNKTSLSPLRSRRNDSSMASVTSNAISRRKLTEYVCQNHNSKPAKFMIDKDNQYFYFCDRCAIPLISNGFKLTKIDQEEQPQQNPRIKEINEFLKQLEAMDGSLIKKKQIVSKVLNQGQQVFDSEIERIEQFYAQFIEIIDEHKRRVVEEMKAEYQKSSRSATTAREIVQEAISNSTNMKQDILSSMNTVILEVMDHEFRSVMNQYYKNLNNFKDICNSKKEEPIKVRTLSFKDSQAVCQALIDGLVIQWDDQEEQTQQKQQRTSKTDTNYQSRPIRRQEQESDRQNPIECLETEERGKSKMKELGGLFCSFDQ